MNVESVVDQVSKKTKENVIAKVINGIVLEYVEVVNK